MSVLSPGTEFSRFRAGLLPKAALVVLLFIPLIYGALYLWAFWAPDEHLDALPVALVNLDEPVVTSDGTTLAAGDDVQRQLLDGGDLGWKVVDADEAARGVADGDYAFSVTLPADLSRNLSSLEGSTPTPGHIDVEYNDTNGFLATTLGHHAMVQVRDAVSQAASQRAAETMLVGVGSLADGLRTAADGAQTIDDGAIALRDGLGDLDTGMVGLSGGLTEAASGAHTLDDGADRVSKGADDVADGLDALAAKTATLDADSARLAQGASQVSTGVTTVSQLAAAHPDMTLAQLDATLAAHGSSLGDLASGASAVSAGTAKLSGDAPVLTDGIGTLQTGAHRLSSGADQAAAGAHDLATAMDQLDAGAQQAATGAADARRGAVELETGTSQLSTALSDAATQAPDLAPDQVKSLSEVLAAPVTLNEVTDHSIQGFGEGFAPFFVALATFVGALITWLILRPQPRRSLASRASGLRSVMTGFVPAMIVGAGQVAIMMLVLVLGIGLRPDHLLGMTLFVALTTLAFLALQQMLIILLGTAAGRVASLVLLMLQLSSSGGTYPVETTPSFFGALHPFMPATYVVNGLRPLLGGGIDERFWVATAYMACLLIGSLAVSALASARQKVWTIARLHPELTV